MVAQNYWKIRVCGGLNAVDINLRYLNDISNRFLEFLTSSCNSIFVTELQWNLYLQWGF